MNMRFLVIITILATTHNSYTSFRSAAFKEVTDCISLTVALRKLGFNIVLKSDAYSLHVKKNTVSRFCFPNIINDYAIEHNGCEEIIVEPADSYGFFVQRKTEASACNIFKNHDGSETKRDVVQNYMMSTTVASRFDQVISFIAHVLGQDFQFGNSIEAPSETQKVQEFKKAVRTKKKK